MFLAMASVYHDSFGTVGPCIFSMAISCQEYHSSPILGVPLIRLRFSDRMQVFCTRVSIYLLVRKLSEIVVG